MKKLLIVGLFAATEAFGGATGMDFDAPAMIVTPTIAIDGVRTNAVSRDADGNMVVCPSYKWEATFDEWKKTCLDKAEKPAWVFPHQMPPKGKKYVGFKIVSGSYGAVYYEFYWK